MKLRLKVVPGASREGIEWLDKDKTILKVRVTAPPVKGKANKAVIKILASTLGLPVRSVIISSGAGSQQKMVELVDVDELALKKILA